MNTLRCVFFFFSLFSSRQPKAAVCCLVFGSGEYRYKWPAVAKTEQESHSLDNAWRSLALRFLSRRRNVISVASGSCALTLYILEEDEEVNLIYKEEERGENDTKPRRVRKMGDVINYKNGDIRDKLFLSFSALVSALRCLCFHCETCPRFLRLHMFSMRIYTPSEVFQCFKNKNKKRTLRRIDRWWWSLSIYSFKST